jgi:integrase
MKVRFRHITVKVYRKSPKYPFYRIAYRADGKRVVRNFKRLNLAKAEAVKKARELAQGNDTAAALTKKDAQSYRFALLKLAELRTGIDHPDSALSLEDAIIEYVAAKRLLQNTRLADAVNGFLSTAATVRRVNLKTTADEFLAERDSRTKSEDGKRAALSPRMAYQDRRRMKKFTTAFATFDVCDLRPEHLDLFFAEHLKDLAPRTRNHFRSTLTVFFKWCVRKSYLAENHSLRKSNGLCPDGKAKETADAGEVEVYTAKEFAALLSTAQGPLQALIAIGGLAGLRTEELLRLTWSDVWRRPGFIEVVGRKAKTRQRRLIPMLPALTAWLSSFLDLKEGKLWAGKFVSYHEHMRELHTAAEVPRRDNALRHGFVSHRLAAIHNEHQVAAECGTSATMIHRHYRELVTPQEAKEWFNVLPAGAVENVLPAPAGTEAAA